MPRVSRHARWKDLWGANSFAKNLPDDRQILTVLANREWIRSHGGTTMFAARQCGIERLLTNKKQRTERNPWERIHSRKNLPDDRQILTMLANRE
jgi:hypothetical protein